MVRLENMHWKRIFRLCQLGPGPFNQHSTAIMCLLCHVLCMLKLNYLQHLIFVHTFDLIFRHLDEQVICMKKINFLTISSRLFSFCSLRVSHFVCLFSAYINRMSIVCLCVDAVSSVHHMNEIVQIKLTKSERKSFFFFSFVFCFVLFFKWKMGHCAKVLCCFPVSLPFSLSECVIALVSITFRDSFIHSLSCSYSRFSGFGLINFFI